MSRVTFQSMLANLCASSRANCTNRAGLATNTNMPKKAVKEVPAVVVGDTHQEVPVSANSNGVVTIKVHVKPSAKRNSITDVSAEAVGLAVAARPTDGEANSELLSFLADVLDVKRSCVSLQRGHRSRDKVVNVDSPLDSHEVLMRLRKAAG